MENKITMFRANVAKFVTFCEAVINMPEPNLSKGYLEAKNKNITSMWSKIDSTNDEILEGGLDFSDVANAHVKKDYDQAFNMFDKVTIKIQTKLERFNTQIQQVQPLQLPENLVLSSTNKSNIKLKPIDIPTFSGDYKKWISFKNMFDSLIHKSKDFSKLQKMHYLQSCLGGEAERMISQYDITEESYDPTYQAITERFHNEVILVDTHIISILSQPDLTSESSHGLKELMDVTTENLRALKSLGINTDSWDPILLLLLVQKLDESTRRLWEQGLQPKVRPTLKQFLDFLGTRFHALGCQQKFKFSMESTTTQQKNKKFTSNNSFDDSVQFTNYDFLPKVHQSFHGSSAKPQRCPFRCDESHEPMKCEKFQRADTRMRYDLVACSKLCKNCLRGHKGKCNLRPGCRTCGKYHHTMLHVEIARTSSEHQNQPTRSPNGKSSRNETNQDKATHHAHIQSAVTEKQLENAEIVEWDEKVLLATAIVMVKSNRDNTFYPFRVLLDQASEASYVSEHVKQMLGLATKDVFANTTGLGGAVTGTIKKVADFEISSKHNPTFRMKVQGPVVRKVTNLLPSAFLKKGEWKHIQELQLADPEYYKPARVDILLGAPVYGYLLLPGLIKSSPQEPIAQNTEFGWILSGPTRDASIAHSISSFHLKINLDDQLRKFFEQEEVSKERIYTKEETECENVFMETYRRKKDGRFVVALPFKSNPTALGSSKGQAISRLMKLENRFKANRELKEEYSAILREYEELNHTTHLGMLKQQTQSQSYYLPHHAVFKPDSTTTKTRVVFDASAKSKDGVSLNDLLMTGPTIQEDLMSILLRWRLYEFSFAADIAKMYRQIEVRKEDRKYQKFIYRKSEEEELQEYQHNMVTFGVTSATYLAVKSLQQLSIEEEAKFPEAAKIVRRDFYMDDGMSGAETEENCIKICKELKELLAKGKFELRKFISNSTKVLESIPEEDRELKLPLEINLSDTIKTLGIHYHPKTDAFQFKINLQLSDEWPTKRSLLSETAKLFDPLGWLAPVIIRAKIMFQRLWQEGLTWEQNLPEAIAKAWTEFRNELHSLGKIRINRWIGKGILTRIFELHGFSDASEAAYAAVIFARIVNNDGNIKVIMLTSKTRVAPIKSLPLPKLELCGLVLLANLIAVVQKSLNVSNEFVHAWTDSTVVLGWLRTNPARLKTFVANRVIEVHNFLNVNQCHHIEGTKNPADCASRGIRPADLKNHSLWWNGPDCLREHQPTWEQNLEIPESMLELKKKCVSSFVITSTDGLEELIGRYSSFERLVKITAICLKFLEMSKRNKKTRIASLCLNFINNVRSKSQKPQLIITVQDLRKAELRIIRFGQGKEFEREIHHLANKKPINTKSKLISLNPFLDKEGCLRVGGRLNEANITYERKHPIILSQGSIAKLIISDSHKKALHGGVKLTMNLIRETYWIINLRRQVKRCILDCVKCCRFKKENSEQIMAHLPGPRVNMSPCFTEVGMDYAGPMKIKASNVRSPPTRIKPITVDGKIIKHIPKVPIYEGYVAVFVCLSTKAIHLEAVSDMTTETFLAAFDRFTARRGFPNCCYTDNGTTFVGAKNVLALEAENSLLDYNKVNDHTTKKGTNWKFITPRAPNQGGIWEAGVKSMKHHLKRVIGDTTLTYEELSTILAKIEACLNSRPLCPLNDDPNDLTALTPGHFLIGRPLVVRPQGGASTKSMGLQERWRVVQKIQDDFWSAWSQDYLNELQNRQKWLVQRRNFKEGDMVLLKEDNVPPAKWPLARIVKVLPSKDGNVRSVTIKTTNEAGKLTELDRPIIKLRLLPMDGNDTPSVQTTDQNQ